ncbi:LysR family transcriptional regulator [Phytomonospora sp. NPDC050363]|uniref:LysR family transcriptional regulator n=1 Tax=Phytomonospora sp. NPDC050363 TaxID=3155642 RepID=UPI0033D3B793
MAIDPGRLRLLALIERHGSLSGAAGELGLTPAAVTQQVAKAEREWQVPLVRRGPRGASLTAAGSLLAAHGRVVDAESVKAAEGLATLLGHLSLRLRIGSFQAAALHLLPPALTALRHRRPHAELSVMDIVSTQGMDQVADGALDMAVIASWGTPLVPPDQVAVHRLLVDPMVVVLPDDHPLAAARSAGAALHLDELRDESWVTILAGYAARRHFDKAAAEAGFTPRVRFQTESYDVMQALIATGIGVGLVSRLALTGVPGTAYRELAQPGPYRELFAVTLADTSATPLVAEFLGLLHDVAEDAGWRHGHG